MRSSLVDSQLVCTNLGESQQQLKKNMDSNRAKMFQHTSIIKEQHIENIT